MTFIPLDANPRPFGAPPSKGRRENTASQTPHTDGFRYENAASPHSSFQTKARNLFRSRQGKGCERNGKRETPCSLRPEKRCFMQTAPYRKRNTANEKDPSAALGMTIRECLFPTHDFHPAAMPTSAPSGHLLPWEGGRIPLHRLPMKKTYDTRMPPPYRHFEHGAVKPPRRIAPSPVSSFRAKARNLFRSRSKKDVRGAGNGKPSAPCAPKKRCFMQAVSCRKMKEKSISNRR